MGNIVGALVTGATTYLMTQQQMEQAQAMAEIQAAQPVSIFSGNFFLIAVIGVGAYLIFKKKS